ncbi:MAG: alpha/beta hydrolase, partial [Comamonadaceae bacterium]
MTSSRPEPAPSMQDDARWDPQMRAIQAGLESGSVLTVMPKLCAPFDVPRAAYERARLAQIDRGGPPHIAARDLQVPVNGGMVSARLYQGEPSRAAATLVYFHGGGWVWGSVSTHDRLCREYAAQAGIAVLSVDYALAPEHRFPCAVREGADICQWMRSDDGIALLPSGRLLLGGDSAGAHVAFGVYLAAKDR